MTKAIAPGMIMTNEIALKAKNMLA